MFSEVFVYSYQSTARIVSFRPSRQRNSLVVKDNWERRLEEALLLRYTSRLVRMISKGRSILAFQRIQI